MGKFVLKNFVIHGVLIDVSKLYTYSAKSLCNGKVSEMGDGAGNLGLHHHPHHRSVSSSNPSLLCGPLSLRLSLSSRRRVLSFSFSLFLFIWFEKIHKKKKKLNDVNFFFLFFLFHWSGFLLFLCLIYSRGLAAARDLSQGELILTVPKSALMTSQSLLKDEKLSVAVKRHTSLSSPQVFHNKLLFWTLFGCPENVGILEKNKHAPLNWA